MKQPPWSPEELSILHASPGPTVAQRRLAGAGFKRTLAAVKGAISKIRHPRNP